LAGSAFPSLWSQHSAGCKCRSASNATTVDDNTAHVHNASCLWVHQYPRPTTPHSPQASKMVPRLAPTGAIGVLSSCWHPFVPVKACVSLVNHDGVAPVSARPLAYVFHGPPSKRPRGPSPHLETNSHSHFWGGLRAYHRCPRRSIFAVERTACTHYPSTTALPWVLFQEATKMPARPQEWSIVVWGCSGGLPVRSENPAYGSFRHLGVRFHSLISEIPQYHPFAMLLANGTA